MDIGGIGFGPDATDVFMEGLYIPMLKLIDQGTVNETLMAMIRANTRLPIDTGATRIRSPPATTSAPSGSPR